MNYAIPAAGSRFRVHSRRLTMFVAALAITLAGLAATTRPAQADAESILRFLAGAVIIAAIVNAVDDNHTPRYIDRWVLPDSCLETARVNGRNIQVYNARCLNRGGYSNLPNHCERRFQINGRSRSGYVADCMWDAGYNRDTTWRAPGRRPPGAIEASPPALGYAPYQSHRALPSDCAMTYRQNGNRRHGYWGSCLRNAGLRNLPDTCRLRTRDGDAVYNRQCMMNAGYRQGH